jgi:hypothetical protein
VARFLWSLAPSLAPSNLVSNANVRTVRTRRSPRTPTRAASSLREALPVPGDGFRTAQLLHRQGTISA